MADNGAEIYFDHIKELQKDEFDRRKALESRGGALLATSSTIIALVFGLTVFLTGDKFTFSDGGARQWLIAALAAFVMSALCALFVQAWSHRISLTSIPTLWLMTSEPHWDHDATDFARLSCAERLTETIDSIRSANVIKAWFAIASFAFQVLAILLLSVALITELPGAIPVTTPTSP
nr:hypothetical protein [uncultured Rhodococcus sp.]